MSIERLHTDKRMSLVVKHEGTVYLSGEVANDFQAGSVWDQWVAAGKGPARATVEAKMCEPGILVEIAVVAALPA